MHGFKPSKYSKAKPVCWLVVQITLSLLLIACGKDPHSQLSADAVIVAFGDSLTAGKGVTSDYAYPAILEQLSGLRVINAGVSGETTKEGLERLPGVLSEYKPDLLILFEGGNDILRNQNLDETRANLNAMIEHAKSLDIQIALVGLPMKKLFSNTAEFYRELAEEHQLPLEDSIVASLLRKPSLKSDSVHFNEAGYEALAEGIRELLVDSGALAH